MKRINKSLVAGAFLALAAIGFASADELKFENKVSTDTIYIGNMGFDDTLYEDQKDYYRFPGIIEKMTMEYTSERVDGKLTLGIGLFGNNQDRAGEKRTLLYLGTYDNVFYNFIGFDDYYIKFRPIEMIQISLGASEKAAGSYFPILDDNVSLGNYTGYFGLLVKPIAGLSIGAGIDVTSYIINDYDPDPDKIYLNFGAEYELENIGSFALTFNNVLNEFGFGAYAKISAINALDLYAGFSYQEDTAKLTLKNLIPHFGYSPRRVYADWHNDTSYSIYGNIILNAAAEYKGIDKLTLAAELATNCFTEADGTFDLYTGLKAEYEINDALSVSGISYMSFDFADSQNDSDYNYCYSPLISFYPEVAYKLGNNTFKAGFKMEFWQNYAIDKDTDRKTQFTAAIPLSWTYAF